MDNLDEASDLLPEISELSSPFGSSPERVAAYFAEALQARIISSCLGTYSPINIKTLTLAHSHRICSSLQSYNSISPLIKFSHFTANQAIFQVGRGDISYFLDMIPSHGTRRNNHIRNDYYFYGIQLQLVQT